VNPFWRFFSSIKLTVFLLATSLLLVFFGTLDQVHFGIWFTQQKYFNSFVAVWQYPLQFPYGEALQWIHLPMPGGYTLGGLLLINLCCAHFRFFRGRWDKSGIALIHGGLVLLLIGQLATQLKQIDYFMWLSEGESKNFIEAFHKDELAVIDMTDPDKNRVYTLQVDSSIRPGHLIQHADWPFTVNVLDVTQNAAIIPRDQAPPSPFPFTYTHGIAKDRNLIYFRVPRTFKEGERNVLTATIQIENESGALATLLVSNLFRDSEPMRESFPHQIIEIDGRQYAFALRFKRMYIPAHIKLREFSHDRYPGTNIPFNFSSDVTIIDQQTGSSRDSLIYMNNPLRFAGLTFYQASFANEDTMSMFQVVRNPARWVPYAASAIISLGLTLQFCLSLFRHLNSRRNKTEALPQ
jgi:hypothetical protein